MQPTLVKQPFQREGWIFEEKVDGYRMLASGNVVTGLEFRNEQQIRTALLPSNARYRRDAQAWLRWLDETMGPERGGGATMIAAIYAHKSTDRAAAGE
jgi:hypothetical protein